MAFYTSGLKQILTDPVIDIENNRIEWRLTPNTLFLSDCQILNFERGRGRWLRIFTYRTTERH